MEKNYTHISVLVDRSGSMSSIREDMLGGLNAFIAEQEKLPGRSTLSVAGFDTVYESWYEFAPLSSRVTAEQFTPCGSTALLDSLARLIDETDTNLKNMQDEKRPEKVFFVVVTDGHENASVSTTKDQVRKAIQEQTDKYKWNFVFLGANQDAITAGAGMGIGPQAAMTYAPTPGSVKAMYSSLSANVGATRSLRGQPQMRGFTEDQRKASLKK